MVCFTDIECALAVPDLETVPFRVLKREAEYEIREVEVTICFPSIELFVL